MTYEEAVCYIEKIPAFAGKTELSNTRQMLSLLGNPQERMTVVHVAGTNGKGSVCAFLAEMCRQSGKKVGMFTSPHLLDIRERIQIDRNPISKAFFAEACDKLREISGQMVKDGYQHPAYFEFLFGMAMEIFAQEKPEIVILETGLGGRLDATNAVEHPAVTVITSVSMDHMEYLGDTIEKIAGEKAGIIKETVPVVYWSGDEKAAAVIEEHAARCHAPTVPVSTRNYKILKITHKKIDFCAFCRYHENRMFSISFSAPYQAANAVLAIETVSCLNENWKQEQQIPEEAIEKGLRHAVWQGRMEEVRQGIIVDGAHNEDGVRAFVEAVEAEGEGKEKYLLFSAVKEKDVEKMARLLCERIAWRKIILTEIQGGRRLSCEVLRALFSEYTKAEIVTCPDIRTAFACAGKMTGAGSVLYCAGFLYLVGEIKALLEEE